MMHKPADDQTHDSALLPGSTPPPPTLRKEPTDENDPTREEREWLENVYQGDTVRQLSPRAIVTGMLIGAVMSVSNLYVGLKTGWGLGVTITACIIAYAVFNVLERLIPAYRDRPFTILENYTMSSAASAAGYMASAGLVSAIPALYLTTGRQLERWEMMLWLGAVSVLGVFMAIPLKRQLINIDKLPFPTGLATAETLRSMHTSGVEAVQKARSLFIAAGAGALLAIWRDGLAPLGAALSRWTGRTGFESFGNAVSFPAEIPILGRSLNERYTLGLEGSLIMVAAGAIMGIRAGVSLLVGGIFFFGIMGPWLVNNGYAQPGYTGIVKWTLWPATAMMVANGLLAFAFKWRTVLRAFSGLTAMLGGGRDRDDPLARVEVPGSWFAIGAGLAGLACVLLGHWLFDIPWWMGIIAVLLTFLLSIVAARATGETDVTPIGAMGKITQLTYGVIAPANMTTNLMTAMITAGAASHSADLLSDLKSGYLIGGNPRKQTISQMFGVLAGTLLCVPVYAIVVKPEMLGTKELPAPSAKVWASVAEMLAKGLKELPPGSVEAMAIGAAVGVLLTLADELLPKKYSKWCPSATALGISGVVPAFNSFSMFLGALAAWLFSKADAARNDKYTVAVSSGLIAGESLMGVAIILMIQGPGMLREIWQAVFPGG
jgi:uncharacterized oligopeptide transporter (OPT) family protein